MAFILARKLKMEQRWEGDAAVPVTILEATPCTITQVRTVELDGYAAIQIGAGARKRLTKAMAGHFGDRGKFRWLREFRTSSDQDLKVGDRIDVSMLKPGDRVRVAATSKGKGFQGVIKRHHFHGQDASHGTKDQVRMPGSISGIGRGGGGPVSKGKRMAGRMGGDLVTVRNLIVNSVDVERGELVLRGAVPGARGALVIVKTDKGSWK
ncbi:MAG: 50S ribosomal protein L3 [Candidatus Uhrbacteria bacterium]